MYLAVAWLTALLMMQGAVSQEPPYQDFKQAGAGFYGDGREDPDPANLPAVRIGVLGPAKLREGLQQRTGIQLAIEDANRRGGYCPKQNPSGSDREEVAHDHGRCIPYEMIFRADDGPWGVGARQVVQLAYEDRVWAIIGGLDGQQTHLAELVVAKAWVPVVSPGATDSTIDYANVPWVFRAVPSDTEQVSALLDLAEQRGYRHLVALTEIQREAHSGYLRLKEGTDRRHRPLEMHLEYSPQNPMEIIPRLSGVPVDALLIWGRAESALTLISGLRKAGIKVPILGPATLATPQVAQSPESLGDLTVASPCDLSRSDPEYLAFARRFKERTGDSPSAVALYSYDVARLVIEAVEAGGLNRARIRDRLSATDFAGLTGKIVFTSLGGNPAKPVLMFLAGSRWVRLE